MLCEIVIQDLVPDDFLPLMRDYAVLGKKYDPDCEKITDMTGCGNKYKAYKMIAKVPWPMSGRYSFCVAYPYENANEGEHIFILSQEGTESVHEQNLNEDEKKNQLLAALHHIGYKWSPIKDDKGKVTGTNMFMTVDQSMGGNIPKWLEEMAGPAGMI